MSSMVSDESADDTDADDPAGDTPVRSALFGLAGDPTRSLALAVAVVLALLYSVFIQQELLLMGWLLAVGFLVYLFWRFVRAHERLAVAAERLVDGSE